MENMKKKCLIFSAFLLFFSESLFSQQHEQELEGKWFVKNTDNSTITVDVYKAKNSFYYGKIIKSSKDGLINKIILNEIIYDKNSDTYKGSLIKPDNGMTASATLTFKDNRTLIVVGKKFFFTKTLTWTKL